MNHSIYSPTIKSQILKSSKIFITNNIPSFPLHPFIIHSTRHTQCPCQYTPLQYCTSKSKSSTTSPPIHHSNALHFSAANPKPMASSVTSKASNWFQCDSSLPFRLMCRFPESAPFYSVFTLVANLHVERESCELQDQGGAFFPYRQSIWGPAFCFPIPRFLPRSRNNSSTL